MLTTTFLACKAPKYLAPAMNTRMYENPITQDNLNICRKYGMHIIEPASGYLACGDIGAGKMPEPETLLEYILQELACEKDLAGKKVLVTAGPTRKPLTRCATLPITPTGKMGYAIARAAARRGAEVTLVSGPVDLKAPMGVKLVPVVSARDMFDAVTSVSAEQDAIIKAAAVADYRPAVVGAEKTKKSDGNMNIELSAPMIFWHAGGSPERGAGTLWLLHGDPEYAGELPGKACKKERGHVVADSLRTAGSRNLHGTNIVTVITKDGAEELALMSKDQVAHELLNRIFAAKH